jgi:hypothetical protein
MLQPDKRKRERERERERERKKERERKRERDREKDWKEVKAAAAWKKEKVVEAVDKFEVKSGRQL